MENVSETTTNNSSSQIKMHSDVNAMVPNSDRDAATVQASNDQLLELDAIGGPTLPYQQTVCEPQCIG